MTLVGATIWAGGMVLSCLALTVLLFLVEDRHPKRKRRKWLKPYKGSDGKFVSLRHK